MKSNREVFTTTSEAQASIEPRDEIVELSPEELAGVGGGIKRYEPPIATV
jgi:hypothetical protein